VFHGGPYLHGVGNTPSYLAKKANKEKGRVKPVSALKWIPGYSIKKESRIWFSGKSYFYAACGSQAGVASAGFAGASGWA
jgi:hypothetical protein